MVCRCKQTIQYDYVNMLENAHSYGKDLVRFIDCMADVVLQLHYRYCVIWIVLQCILFNVLNFKIFGSRTQ